MKEPDIIEIALGVVRIFEALGIEYYIGGSLASSAFGIARSTMDIDIAADIRQGQASVLEERLQTHFYVDREMIERAIREKSSFNIVHLETMFKIDIFVVSDEPYDKQAMARRLRKDLTADGANQADLSSPEDIILRKLLWYQSGGKISDRQWDDVLGVMRVQGEQLDAAYLELWAKRLSIFDLLQKAFQEAGLRARSSTTSS
jgi:hypothetical protein